jgi:hypothetical protein
VDATAANFNAPLSELDSAITNTLTGAQAFTQLNLGVAALRIIALDMVTTTTSRVKLQCETGATDNLATISGGADGDVVILQVNTLTDTVTIKHNTGNIWLPGGADVALTSHKKVMLVYDGPNAKWCGIG